jgi:hypothetical protein
MNTSALLHDDMPVIRFGGDVNDADPAVTARQVIEKVRRRQPFRFHVFRAVLRSPNWYRQVHDHIVKLDDSIVWLDPQTFFTLLKNHLQKPGQ